MADGDFSLSANVAGLKALAKLEDAITAGWYSTTLLYKLTDGSSAATSLTPRYWLSTALYQATRNVLINSANLLNGMTSVHFGSRRAGKTFAAHTSLRRVFGHTHGSVKFLGYKQ